MRGRSVRLLAVLVAGTACCVVGALPCWGQASPKYAGSETCKDCHEQQWTQFQSNVHAVVATDPELVADVVGCESCHGPGSAHAEAAGERSDPGFATIRSFAALEPAEANDVCRACHQGGEHMYWAVSDHARNDVACVRCHSIHGSKSLGGKALLATAEVTQLCLQCHEDKHLALARTAHMPLREGAMTCSDCHNPHGSAAPRGLRAQSTNELCLTCHSDKRGPFLWEHAPVRENCLNCHDPHGSNNPQVLASKLPFLCQRCHIATRHPSTLYDSPDLAQNRLFNRSCVNCHSQVHGSNHPSGKTFLR